MTEIKRNIPMPSYIKKKQRQTKYPWADMEVGDCFDTPEDVSATVSASAVQMANKRYAPKVFRREKLPSGAYRMWRVE